MRGLEHILRHALRTHAVATLDLVRERDRLAGQATRNRLHPGQLEAEPACAPFVETVEPVRQRGRVGSEVGGCPERLGVDALRDLRRPVVAVDDPVDVPPEAQSQLEVGGDRLQAREPTEASAREERGLALAHADAERRKAAAAATAA